MLFSKSRKVSLKYSIFQFPAIVCLYLCGGHETIDAHGPEFSAEEFLFLSKTFESVGSSRLQIDMVEGCNPLNIMNTIKCELFE